MSENLKVLNICKNIRPTLEDVTTHHISESMEILEHEKFDKSKPTALYLHGFHEHQSSESVETIVKSYYENGNYNILTLDWTIMCNGSYFKAAFIQVNDMGTAFAPILMKMFENGLDIEKFHLIGHSLGGQLAGIIGRVLHNQSGNSLMLKRITALDPAFPGFLNTPISPSVSGDDAEFVDIIHTDSGIYGTPFALGDADFFPNGGLGKQPGCPLRNFEPLTDLDLCSHRRSWAFWAESVIGKTEPFWAIPAKKYTDFITGKNKNYTTMEDIVVMGNNCPTK